MISKKGNHFSYEETVKLHGSPQEYLKTNKVYKRPTIAIRPMAGLVGLKGIKLSELLKGMNSKMKKEIKATRISFVLNVGDNKRAQIQLQKLEQVDENDEEKDEDDEDNDEVYEDAM